MKEREHLNSRLGFILLSAGCAIGCGNVWKFPWMCGQYGGGVFIVVYIFFLILIGLPVMTMEFSIGRAAQASPVNIYKRLEKPGQKWGIFGYVYLISSFILMAFYTVVTGWLIHYFVEFLTGHQEGLCYSSMITNPKVNVIYLAVTVIIGFGILIVDIQKGLEKVTKYLMLLLLALMAVLAIRSFTLSGAAEGMSFYLKPDFSNLNGNVIVAAMNQAFFSLSLGLGSMAMFGSYIDKERTLLGESANIVFLDTSVAIVAGFIIFPACFTYGIEPNSGPSLLFDTMATVFQNTPGGRWWGTLFFLFMFIAAISTVLTIFETILSCVRDIFNWSRLKGCCICAICVFVLSLTTALGNSLLHFQPFAEGTTWMDFWDFLVSTNLLPLGSFVIVLFCTNKRYGWGWDKLLEEANSGKGIKLPKWAKGFCTYCIPLLILFIYIYGLITFDWK